MLEEEKKEELLALLTGKKYRELKSQLVEMNEVDIASFIEELDSEKTVVVFRMLPKELASEVFACLEVEQQQHIITSITDNELRAIIDDLYVDDAVDMLEELPATIVRRVLQNSSPDTRKLINQFLNYPENSAGSVMTAEYVGLKKNMTVEQAFDYIRKYGVDKETIYTCYVMDEKRRLEGVVTVKDLLMNDYAALMGDIMDPHVIKAYTTEDQEKVVETFNEYNLLSLPVVDGEDRLVGIITVDDVMDVMEQEATEDFEKMAAMLPSEKPYLKTGVFQLARNRIPWLMILMLSSMVTGGILLKYENAFSVIPHFAKMSLSCELGFSRSPMNRCSTEIYSSFICFAFSSAAVNALSTSGDTYTFSGSLPLPVTFGIPAALCSVSLVSCEASAPIFFIS